MESPTAEETNDIPPTEPHWQNAPSAEAAFVTCIVPRPWTDTFYVHEEDIEAVFDMDVDAIRMYHSQAACENALYSVFVCFMA